MAGIGRPTDAPAWTDDVGPTRANAFRLAGRGLRSSPSRDRPARRPRRPPPPARRRRRAPAAGVDDLLRSATEEAARLLGADGAILYLLDPQTGRLRFTHDAGIAELRRRTTGCGTWSCRSGVGLFGQAVADRRVVVTGDYIGGRPVRPRGDHGPLRRRGRHPVDGRRAPMTAGDEVFGALGVFAAAEDAFTAPQIALVRALSDHAALAMANARLIDELARSREAIERQADRRALAARAGHADLGRPRPGGRRPAHDRRGAAPPRRRRRPHRHRGPRGRTSSAACTRPGDEEILETEWPRDLDDRLEVGASGPRRHDRARPTSAATTSRTTTIVHSIGPDTYARSKGIHGVIATPLFGDQGPFGAITVWSLEEPTPSGPTTPRCSRRSRASRPSPSGAPG